jgi:hypothetical protein
MAADIAISRSDPKTRLNYNPIPVELPQQLEAMQLTARAKENQGSSRMQPLACIGVPCVIASISVY